MTIKTISLAFVFNAAGSPKAAIHYAMNLARSARAHLVVRIGVPPLMIPALGHPIHAAASQMLAVVERENLVRKQEAEQIASTIRTDAINFGVTASVEVFSAAYDPLAPYMSAVARVSDICIVPAPSDKERLTREFVVDILFGAGGPLLLVPASWAGDGSIRKVIVAWDASAAAARALRDSLPLLADDASVEVLSVVGEKEIESASSGLDVATRLGRHCRNVSIRSLQVLGEGVAATLFHHARVSGADLMVMGGYGHSRFREFILGGVTRDVLTRTEIPTLLSH